MLNFFRYSFYRLLFCVGYDFLFSSVPCYICGDLCIWKKKTKNKTPPPSFTGCLHIKKELYQPSHLEILIASQPFYSDVSFLGLFVVSQLEKFASFFFFFFPSCTCLASLALTSKVSGLGGKKSPRYIFCSQHPPGI